MPARLRALRIESYLRHREECRATSGLRTLREWTPTPCSRGGKNHQHETAAVRTHRSSTYEEPDIITLTSLAPCPPRGARRWSTPAIEEFRRRTYPGAVNLHEISRILQRPRLRAWPARPEVRQRLRCCRPFRASDGDVLPAVDGHGFGQSCRGYFLLQHLGYPNAVSAWRHQGLDRRRQAAVDRCGDTGRAAFPTVPGRSQPGHLRSRRHHDRDRRSAHRQARRARCRRADLRVFLASRPRRSPAQGALADAASASAAIA